MRPLLPRARACGLCVACAYVRAPAADPNTGYTYYWNPNTSVTQYDRPAGGPAAPPPQVRAFAAPARTPFVAAAQSWRARAVHSRCRAPAAPRAG
jgi:hypothetical protein